MTAHPDTSYSISALVNEPFDDVAAATREALADNGFGVITEIDFQATMKNKLDVDTARHYIWGACSPGHAHRAMQADPAIGLLLPCNVVIREVDEGTLVEMINTGIMSQLSASPQMQEIADEVGTQLQAALDAVAGSE